MRTAITLGKTHDGKWEMLADPGVPMLKQFEDFRRQRGLTSHDKYSLLVYQESDSEAQEIRLRSPAEQKAHDERRAAEADASQKLSKEQAEAAAKAAKEAEERRTKEHAETIKKANAEHEASQARFG